MVDKIEFGSLKMRMILKLIITTHPFIISEYLDAISEVMDLKQTGTVQGYYEELEGFYNLLQLTEKDALHIFINNLKPEISTSISLFYPKTLTHALKLAKQVESMPIYTQTSPKQSVFPSFLPKPEMASHANLSPLFSSSTLFNPISDFVLTNKSDPKDDFVASDEDNKLLKECDVVGILGDPEASRFCYLIFH